jgi:hypothetical protein
MRILSLLPLALALAGCGSERAPAPVTGAEAFQRDCASCHAEGVRSARVERLSDPAVRSELDAFLARHHAPDPERRRLILDHLERGAL